MLLWWIAACGFSFVFAMGLGFFSWKNLTLAPEFVGIKNFVTFFTDSSYLQDLWRTVWIGVGSSVLVTLAGLGIGLLMNAKIKGKGVYRSVWYMPAVTSSIAITQVLAVLLLPEHGFNILMRALGLEQIVLETSFGWSVAIIMLYSLWRGIGPCAILWLAGLQSVEPVLYEAAAIDGAGRFRQFLYVTLPGLKPMATYVIITGIIGSLQIYESVAFITRGGPNGLTRVLSLRILEDGYTNFNFGMAGASGLVLAVIIFVSALSFYVYSTRSQRKEGKA
jgi:ABC-type sugar transport system permease subunit